MSVAEQLAMLFYGYFVGSMDEHDVIADRWEDIDDTDRTCWIEAAERVISDLHAGALDLGLS